MVKQSPLPTSKIVTFVGTTDPVRAKAFYRDKLGLAVLSEDPFAVVFDANGTMLRVSIVPKVVVAGYTVAGWNVPDAVEAAQYLKSAGIQCERYEGMSQDALGIWSAPGGAKVAWFKDPDGNTLSISELPG
jgi:catechol 2,3-dioxygenase-like lactoylglutathione lyase family enzyme